MLTLQQNNWWLFVTVTATIAVFCALVTYITMRVINKQRETQINPLPFSHLNQAEQKIRDLTAAIKQLDMQKTHTSMVIDHQHALQRTTAAELDNVSREAETVNAHYGRLDKQLKQVASSQKQLKQQTDQNEAAIKHLAKAMDDTLKQHHSQQQTRLYQRLQGRELQIKMDEIEQKIRQLANRLKALDSAASQLNPVIVNAMPVTVLPLEKAAQAR